MPIQFEIDPEIEQQIRDAVGNEDLSHDAKYVYLMEQYRQGRLTHRQLQAALGLSFTQTEVLLKQRGLGQDVDPQDYEAGRSLLRDGTRR
jgi:hypothetical protein